MITTISHHDFLMEFLRDPKEALAYLNAVSAHGNVRYLLVALRNVVEAQGGIGRLANKTKLSRTTLYRTLSETGNPEFNTLEAILAVYDIQVGFFPRNGKSSSRPQSEASSVASPKPRYRAKAKGRRKGRGTP